MDLTSWLLRHTPPRPLVATTPGGIGARLAVERVIRERGWRVAASPAEANILVVAGPITRQMQPYVQQVWSLVPAPRVRVDVDTAAAAWAELDAATRTLRDAGQQREQAVRASQDTHETPGHEQHEHEGHEGDGDSGQSEHGQHEQHSGEHDQHEESDDQGHNHHGHDMGDMEMPGGVPMADRAEDRDGLMLDQLHVPLGPLLPEWPAGLVIRTTLQGDVIQEATAEVVGLDGAPLEPFWTDRSSPPVEAARRVAARRLDSCAKLLSIAGWPDASSQARVLRDQALRGEHVTETAKSFAQWARHVRRSRMLRWSLTGVGATPDDPSTPPALGDDALTRLHTWIASASAAFDQSKLAEVHESELDGAQEAQWTLAVLPALLEGQELANARLLVASLDPDLETLTHHEVHHG